jgi:hypothetical protein
MATVDGKVVDCVLLLDGVEERGVSSGAELIIGAERAAWWDEKCNRREILTYEGPVTLRGERFVARVPVSIFACNPHGYGGVQVRIAASGPLERL